MNYSYLIAALALTACAPTPTPIIDDVTFTTKWGDEVERIYIPPEVPQTSVWHRREDDEFSPRGSNLERVGDPPSLAPQSSPRPKPRPQQVPQVQQVPQFETEYEDSGQWFSEQEARGWREFDDWPDDRKRTRCVRGC